MRIEIPKAKNMYSFTADRVGGQINTWIIKMDLVQCGRIRIKQNFAYLSELLFICLKKELPSKYHIQVQDF